MLGFTEFSPTYKNPHFRTALLVRAETLDS